MLPNLVTFTKPGAHVLGTGELVVRRDVPAVRNIKGGAKKRRLKRRIQNDRINVKII